MNGYNTLNRDECVIISYNDRQEFYFWCKDNKIHCQYEGSLDFDPWQPFHERIKAKKLGTEAKEVWYIKDERDRAWARLRWS